jgi:3-oxoacyl-[acyl-carrier protein] reductase
MASKDEFKNKGILITGAGRGIGKRLALGFATAGARVGLLARSKAELDLTHLEIEHGGGTALRLRADVRDADQVSRAVDLMHAKFGEIHALICSAGVSGPVGPFLGNARADWVDAIQINVIGVMHCCAAVLSEMAQRRSGKVVVLGGGGGAKPRPYFSSYAASKAANARFIETLAEEFRDYNVQLNCMAPGETYTHMTDEILKAGEGAGWKEQQAAMQTRLTGGTPPEKQIALAMFLVSERSNHVSGKLIHVDDDWKKLLDTGVNPDMFTLRRVQRG